MKKFKKYIGLLIIPFCLSLFSCGNDDPKNIDSPDETAILEIKILNGGINGDSTVIGRIDEAKKEISFPRLDTLTVLTALKFEATMSDRAVLDTDIIDFTVEEGETQKRKIVTVVNGKRKREYFLTVRLNVPLFGADFDKPIRVMNHSASSKTQYSHFASLATRGSGFDGEHVLVISRLGGVVNPHLLKVTDLENNVVAPIALSTAGIAGGTFPVCTGALANGHIYVANLTGASIPKIYYWATPTSVPVNITDGMVAPAGMGARYGDNISVNLDENGNGFIYFGANSAIQNTLRLTVANYTTVSDPVTLVSGGAKLTGYMSITRIWNELGATSEYIYTGYESPIILASDGLGAVYTMGATSTPVRGSDARVITFNKERYLIMCTAARNPATNDVTVFYVYNITKGETVKDAMQLFDARDDKAKIPDYQLSLGGGTSSAPSTQTGWHITKDGTGEDETLYLYAASTDVGFVVFQFPKKSSDD